MLEYCHYSVTSIKNLYLFHILSLPPANMAYHVEQLHRCNPYRRRSIILSHDIFKATNLYQTVERCMSLSLSLFMSMSMSLVEVFPGERDPKQIFQTIQRYDNFWNKLLKHRTPGSFRRSGRVPATFISRMFLDYSCRLKGTGQNFRLYNEI